MRMRRAIADWRVGTVLVLSAPILFFVFVCIAIFFCFHCYFVRSKLMRLYYLGTIRQLHGDGVDAWKIIFSVSEIQFRYTRCHDRNGWILEKKKISNNLYYDIWHGHVFGIDWHYTSGPDQVWGFWTSIVVGSWVISH